MDAEEWAALFDRAAEFEPSETDVRSALEDVRASSSAGDDGTGSGGTDD